jgi:predicted KAP-like P-loop ATPase
VKILLSLLDYLFKTEFINKKTIIQLKEEINRNFRQRKNKLIIVIDDIDRLTKDEISQLFQLIKINADFPNVIYLLAFDREIVENNLTVQDGFSGRDYLEKIVQVSFNVPYVSPTTIYNLLFKELDAILNNLPNHDHMFDKDHWQDIYHFSVKYLFKNLRDVKRFVNSLKFNISMLYDNKIIEVNPIDFLAIEAIRIFIPDLYNFIKKTRHF